MSTYLVTFQCRNIRKGGRTAQDKQIFIETINTLADAPDSIDVSDTFWRVTYLIIANGSQKAHLEAARLNNVLESSLAPNGYGINDFKVTEKKPEALPTRKLCRVTFSSGSDREIFAASFSIATHQSHTTKLFGLNGEVIAEYPWNLVQSIEVIPTEDKPNKPMDPTR